MDNTQIKAEDVELVQISLDHHTVRFRRLSDGSSFVLTIPEDEMTAFEQMWQMFGKPGILKYIPGPDGQFAIRMK